MLLPETGEQAEIGLKYQPAGFNGHFGIAVFDLKRQNVPTTVPGINVLLQNQTGEITSRGLELEAVANLAPGLKLVGAFTTYDLFTSKDANPALIGLTPTNMPQQTGIALGRLHVPGRAADRALALAAACVMSANPFADIANTLVVPSVVLGDAAVHYEWQNWRAALNVINIADTIYVASCASAIRRASTATAAGRRRACRTSGSAPKVE